MSHMLPYYDQLKHWALRDDMRGFDCLGADELGAEYTAAPSLADVRSGLRVIGRGMKGDSVMYVQGLAGAIADGEFGAKTEDAVRAFQRSKGLADTGIVNQSTLAALDVLAQGGTAGVEKIDFSKPSAPTQSTMSFPVSGAGSPKSVALVPVASGVQPNWWTQPAWQGTNMKRWQVATAGAGGAVVLGGLFAWLVGSAARVTK